MPLPLPDLDDRTFEDLLQEARRQISRAAPEWTDLSPGDPGIILLELFAHLTETMIYRLNRLPEKAYIAFLRLLGVSLFPPSAAAATLQFSRSRPSDEPLEIPRGTRVTVGQAGAEGQPPVFVTGETVQIPAQATTVSVVAHHCEVVEGELLGVGSGLPGLSLVVARPPLIAPTGNALDLVVGVEATPEELQGRVPARQHGGRAYRIWREVQQFTNVGADRHVYVADRVSGTITFAPAARMRRDEDETDGENGMGLEPAPHALAAAPEAGREIRVWYRRGGGPAGNVAAGTLTTLKDALPGVEVTNPAPASGGQAAETLENALVRGPQELHSLQRAVTARDFELIALRSARGGIARAIALTSREIWAHAQPGAVDVLLVPDVPDEQLGEGRIAVETLRAHESDVARRLVQDQLDERRPLGTTCRVQWARYKPVQIQARIVVGRQENQEAVRRRVLQRLYRTINPLPTALNESGWSFGRALRASDIFSIALAEPGVRWVDRVRFLVGDVPGRDVRTVAADHFQDRTWYAGSGDTLFRSLNDGEGWEPAARFGGELVHVVQPSPNEPGVVAVLTRLEESGESQLHVSRDCAESWSLAHRFEFGVRDLAWLQRGALHLLMLATDRGLFELAMTRDATPVPRVVDAGNPNHGLYAVAALEEVRGIVTVAVAADSEDGVYLSNDAAESFRLVGLENEDVRVLGIQQEAGRAFLWAGVYAVQDETGKGCFRWALSGREDPPEGWQPYNRGWQGGSCRCLAFLGATVVAGTHRAGVLRLNMGQPEPGWQALELESGLPLREAERLFEPIDGVAARAAPSLILAASNKGVYRSNDGGDAYDVASSPRFVEKVTLPDNWLFVSGEHEISVVSEDEAS